MKSITLYQTLEDRDNPDIIERDGPFPCRRSTAWLGDGYYFWDTHKQLAHWWGKQAYGKGKYIICVAKGIFDDSCWDLHGDGNHQLEFEQVCHEIVKKGLSSKKELLVPNVITYMKEQGIMKYKAIRCLGMDSISYKSSDYQAFRIFFSKKGYSYLDLRPAVQICLFTKGALSLNSYMVVFPDYYLENTFA